MGMAAVFPFSAIVAQDEMKLALACAAVDAGIGGVLVFGDRGTGKSTAVRALAALLPKMQAVEGCPYNCDPAAIAPVGGLRPPGRGQAPPLRWRPQRAVFGDRGARVACWWSDMRMGSAYPTS